jgi:hypothetical protein
MCAYAAAGTIETDLDEAERVSDDSCQGVFEGWNAAVTHLEARANMKHMEKQRFWSSSAVNLLSSLMQM